MSKSTQHGPKRCFNSIAKRFPFFKEERDVTLPELIVFCENQNQPIKAFEAVRENKQLIKDNYGLMQLYVSSLSPQTKKTVRWTIDNFKYEFNKTNTDVMMLKDGISENSWSDLMVAFRRICKK